MQSLFSYKWSFLTWDEPWKIKTETIVSVNGESRVNLFDDTKTYIHSVNANGTGELIEYVAAFPNMTVNVGDEYKVCALTIKDSNLICQTGTNSPALRPEFKDLYLQEEKQQHPKRQP